jgi:hypothetical protein
MRKRVTVEDLKSITEEEIKAADRRSEYWGAVLLVPFLL